MTIYVILKKYLQNSNYMSIKSSYQLDLCHNKILPSYTTLPLPQPYFGERVKVGLPLFSRGAEYTVIHRLIAFCPAAFLRGSTAFFTAKLTFAFRHTPLNFLALQMLGFYHGRCQLQGAKTYRTILNPRLDNLGLFLYREITFCLSLRFPLQFKNYL